MTRFLKKDCSLILPGLLLAGLLGLSACGAPPQKTTAQNTTLRAPAPPLAFDASVPLDLYGTMALALRAELPARTAASDAPQTKPPAPESAPESAWTALDHGIALVQQLENKNNPTALQAGQHHRAALAIARDVRSAWFRAAGAQALDAAIASALPSATPARAAHLMALRAQLDSGRVALAALLHRPDLSGIRLAAPPEDEQGSAPGTTPDGNAFENLDRLELLALVSRGELSGRTPEKSLAAVADTRQAALETFPSIAKRLKEIRTAGAGPPGNPAHALSREAFAARFADGLVRLHTVPLALQDAQSRIFLKTAQEQAMTAAILTQVDLAYRTYLDKKGAFLTAAAQKENASENKTAALESRAQLWLSKAALEKAEMTLIGSLGADILPAKAATMTTAQLAHTLQQRMETGYITALNQWAGYVVAHAQNPPGTAFAQNSVSEPPAQRPPAALQLAAYTPVRPGFMPLARKIATHNGAILPASGADPSSFLTLTHWQVHSLLAAPITEP